MNRLLQLWRAGKLTRRLRFEPLEDRRLLATFTLSNLSDGPVNGPGDLSGSLRQAIYDANNTPGADEIVWQDGLNGTIALQSGELLITDNVTITALGDDQTKIDGAHSSRVFNIEDDTPNLLNVRLSSMTITGGSALTEGGGIRNHETLTVTGSTISGNRVGGTPNSYGGGIFSFGNLRVTESTIAGNVAAADLAFGGGIYSRGDVTVTDSTISENAASGYAGPAAGGGIYSRGDVTVTDSSLLSNVASSDADAAFGGGIYSRDDATLTVTVTNSTISENAASGHTGALGGGIWSNGDAMVTVTNSTISQNAASVDVGGWPVGGGICARGDATVTVTDSTISGNSATGGGFGTGGGISSSDNLTVIDSTISDNVAAFGGGIYSRGDVTVTDSTISENGAVAALSRAVGGGLYSLGNLTVSDSTISGNVASGYGAYGGGVWSDGDATVTDSTISGNSATDTSAAFGALGGGIQSLGNLIVTDSTIFGNVASGESAYGGGISGGSVTVTDSTIVGNIASGEEAQGGGIRSGYLTIKGSTISDNAAESANAFAGGGGILSLWNLAVIDSTISGNVSSVGGGIFARTNTGGTTTIDGSTISGNLASASERRNAGGGIYVSSSGGMTTITGSTISGNSAYYGGGIYSRTDSNGTTTIDGSTISGNSAYYGPNFFPASGSATVTFTFSLIGDNSGSGLTEAQTPDANGNLIGDLTGSGIIDPLLGPLADNGGSTLTHALLPGSPAIDAGDPAAMPGVGNTPLYDQRGEPYTRVFDGDAIPIARIDIGAYELQPVTVDGDFNDDGLYDCLDIDELIGQIAAGTNGLAYDLTGDGLVDLADRDAWLVEAGEINLGTGQFYLLGDANLDGFVDGSDFVVWNANKFSTLTVIPGWCQGNFNADASVNSRDFLIWDANKFQSSGLQVPPIPPKSRQPQDLVDTRDVQMKGHSDTQPLGQSQPLAPAVSRRIDAAFASITQRDEGSDKQPQADVFDMLDDAFPINSWVL